MQAQAVSRGLVTARLPSGCRCRRRRHVVAAAPSGGLQPQAATPTIVTDAAVPEGHQGLHGFLYGEGGAEAHDAGSSYTFREVMALPWLLPRMLRADGSTCAYPVQHSCSSTARHTPAVQDEDDGSALLPVGPWLAAREGEKPVSRSLLSVHSAVGLA